MGRFYVQALKLFSRTFFRSVCVWGAEAFIANLVMHMSLTFDVTFHTLVCFCSVQRVCGGVFGRDCSGRLIKHDHVCRYEKAVSASNWVFF